MVKNNISKATHTLGFTQFADLTSEEFNVYKGFNNNTLKNDYIRYQEYTQLDSSAAASVDWRNQGVLTPVKNQEQCGSCWAFSAIETLESHEKMIANKSLEVLSPQELVDCDTNDSGCNGGLMQNAYSWMAKGNGEESGASYP